ncbi:tyrosine-type recombinase/integrase [Arvimicrobium flavum]|uniref:tyrosine-type recombinase/integrase n=1 Tax=Arvimicrobium flavum TaxID=3393320 RepID=UPI00237BC0EA|nr:tyrosine-type recombinase/integrase [Mesorhizobium shangrilense]
MTGRKHRRLPKYVTEFTAGGKTYVYFRRHGKKVRIKGTPWSDDFMQAYRAMLSARVESPPPVRIGVVNGTLKKLVNDYYECAEFSRLDDRTQRVRRGILDRICEIPLRKEKPNGKQFGDMPLGMITGKVVRAIRDRDTRDTPEAANARVKALRQVFTFAIADEQLDKNPARDIPYIQTGSQGFHSWEIEEVEKFEERHPVGTKARLALALLLYTGQRRSDIVTFGRQHVRSGWLKFTQVKNKRNKPVTLEIPIVDELQRIIDASPTGDLNFLVTEFKKPFTANGFGNWFRDRCDEAGLRHCSAHGLRKAAAARLADQGKSEHEIMAITGHQTSKEVTRYTKAARQKVLAARAFGVPIAGSEFADENL